MGKIHVKTLLNRKNKNMESGEIFAAWVAKLASYDAETRALHCFFRSFLSLDHWEQWQATEAKIEYFTSQSSCQHVSAEEQNAPTSFSIQVGPTFQHEAPDNTKVGKTS